MGGLFGNNNAQAAAPAPAPSSIIGPYPDDNVRRMPVVNSPNSIEAGRRRRREIMARSGRTSTRLVSEAGTRAYTGTLLGNTQ